LTTPYSTDKIWERQGSSVVEHFIHNEAVMGPNPILGTKEYQSSKVKIISSFMKFIFKGYNSNLEKGEISFNYGFKGEKNIDFTERISFPPVANKIPEALLNSLLSNLMLILGVSYWKLYCPREIVVESNFLTREQAKFWNTVYAKGFGEFFYQNKIDFRDITKFPYVENKTSKSEAFPRQDRILLGIGGGKDSIAVAEMLKEQNKKFDIFTGEEKIKQEVASVIGKTTITVKRELDPKLFDLNKEKGTYNGHIPISAIYAFLGIIACVFYNYTDFLVGNEKSANYGNVEYLGEMINHQWSKSEEFEALFRNYVKQFITPSVNYSSPLRDMTELQVVEEFAKYPQYFKIFSSCNRNFKINNPSAKKWCGECPKCLFVFICLAAFLPKDKVISIFGKNLMDERSLLPLFEELVGVRNFKPFECVGEPEEVKEALEKISEKDEFKESFLLKHYETIRAK
jgi:UDP-N-acetyl-alpha-D-muramoyl-L-alanyl-L-glutamate epimerase